jgi:hypothetical protein
MESKLLFGLIKGYVYHKDTIFITFRTVKPNPLQFLATAVALVLEFPVTATFSEISPNGYVI